MPSRSQQRLVAFGAELIDIHRRLRTELARLRQETGAFLDGHGDRPRELKAHCLAFCSVLTRHHTGEDGGAFPALAGQFPELRPVIDKMAEDHELISALLQNLEQILDSVPEEPVEAEAARIRAELDGLSAIVESHFSFEERTIVSALNSLPPEAGSTEGLLGLPTEGA